DIDVRGPRRTGLAEEPREGRERLTLRSRRIEEARAIKMIARGQPLFYRSIWWMDACGASVDAKGGRRAAERVADNLQQPIGIDRLLEVLGLQIHRFAPHDLIGVAGNHDGL